MKPSSGADLAACIDWTLAGPLALKQDVETFCAEARKRKIRSVCVPGFRVEMAYAFLEETEVKVTGLVGFPYGVSDPDVKRFEAETAVDQGAGEIEFVTNLAMFKDGEHKAVLREMRDIVEAAEERPVKVVVETSLLDDEETRLICALVLDSGARFLTTSAGINPASVEEVRRLREMLGPKFGIKAAGGIRDRSLASALVEAGATCLSIDGRLDFLDAAS